MVLTIYSGRQALARYRVSPTTAEELGAICRELIREPVLVSSDEDQDLEELTDSQIELYEEIADYQQLQALAIAYTWAELPPAG